MIVVGIDEVGRGCWAGPLVAGAVILNVPIEGLKDSKLLTRNKREYLDKIIRQKALSFGLGWVEAQEIDNIGLSAAVALAMNRALLQISIDYDKVIIDGNYNFMPNNTKAEAIIKADSKVPAVSAASVIAKVARDNYMFEMAKEYPKYGFEKHVGYGTALHSKMLNELGLTPLHRRTFKPVSLAILSNHN